MPTAVTSAPQLLLAAKVLRALEHHDLPMHARDYRDTALWLREELQALAPGELAGLVGQLPASLCDIAENLLHESDETAWCSAPVGHPNVVTVWAECLQRLRQGSR